MSSPVLYLDLNKLRVLKKTLDNWHFWRAGELIDEDDRVAAELEAEVDALLTRFGGGENVSAQSC